MDTLTKSYQLTPISEDLSGISVDEIHNFYDHSIDNTGDEQEYSCPECGVLIVDHQRKFLHLKVDCHDVEGQVEAEKDKGQRHKVDAKLSLGIRVERLLTSRYRVEPKDAMETGPRFFKCLLPAQCAPMVG